MSDQTPQNDSISRGVPGGHLLGQTEPDGGISRRGLLRVAGISAAVVGGGGLLEACSSSIKGASASSSTSASSGSAAGQITIGWIHPLTGSLAGFGAADNFVTSKIKATSQYKNGFKIGGKTYDVTIKSYDTQSSPTRPASWPSRPSTATGWTCCWPRARRRP